MARQCTIFFLICCVEFVHGQNTPMIQYDPVTHQFSISNIGDPFTAPGAKNKAYWTYFWEFGDGHYSESVKPSHCYDQEGNYSVRVHLTPYYSYDPSQVIRNDIKVEAEQCTADRDYDSFSGLVDIFSNTDGELIPNNETRLVVRFKMPPQSSSGYMLFLFNSTAERKKSKLNFFPVQFVRDGVSTQNQLDVREAFNRNTSSDIKDLIRPFLDDYNFEIIPCEAEPGSEGSLFLSVMASKSLDTTIIQGKKGILESSLKAIWLPQGYGYDPDQQSTTHWLRILSVHDPNRLRITQPRGSVYYRRRDPPNLEYKVDFQNKGGRPARQVDVIIPWPKNLNASTIEIEDRDPSIADGCIDCPPDFNPSIDSTLSCFGLDTSGVVAPGQIKFTFYNVSIHGKREKGVGGGKYSKGSITYSVRSNRKMVQRSRQNADIIFMGGDTFTTKTDSKPWRYKALGLRAGVNFDHAVNGFISSNTPVYHQFQAGLYYRYTPTFNGLGYGFEAAISRFEFDHRSRVQQFDDGEPISLLLGQEAIQMLNFDLLFQVEARLFSAINAGIGVGFTVPLIGQGTLLYNDLGYKNLNENEYQYLFAPNEISESLFNDLLERPSQSQGSTESGFGLFPKNSRSDYRENELAKSNGAGGMLQWFVEVGMLNNIAIGMKQDFRVYPRSYKGQCLKFNNFSIYCRFKLTTL